MGLSPFCVPHCGICAPVIPADIGDQVISVIYEPSVTLGDGALVMHSGQFHGDKNIVIMVFVIIPLSVEAVAHIGGHVHQLDRQFRMRYLGASHRALAQLVKLAHAA